LPKSEGGAESAPIRAETRKGVEKSRTQVPKKKKGYISTGQEWGTGLQVLTASRRVGGTGEGNNRRKARTENAE